MGFLSKLFGHNNHSIQNTAITVKNNSMQPGQPMLTIHPDILNYIWIYDGEHKNYTPTNNTAKINVHGFTFTISFTTIEEPSLIYMSLPIADVNGNVDRPPYYPTYRGLTPEQRGIYWKLLANPYDNTIDIGYVFILYYGLERYLLTDKYEQVIDIILKLRDIHQNKSFQSYTADAIILTCIQRHRADIVYKFMNSLDKEYEFCFSPDLFLLCKYALDLPLTADDIMRMAKSFEFTKNNYIKKYPDLFFATLSQNIINTFESDAIPWNRLITNVEFNKLNIKEISIFANMSIMDKFIKVPSMLTSFKLKKSIYDLLDKTHEDVKKQLTEKKRNGEIISESEKTSSKNNTEVVLLFDRVQEQLLLNDYNSKKNNSLKQHFVSISIQDFYYKYRNIDQQYLEKCIEFCKDDISKLQEIQRAYIEEEKNRILSYQWLTPMEKKKEISEIKPFYATIPAFKRLVIIYEKEKKYDSAINICEQAISFYASGDMKSKALEFSERKQKLLSKKKK